MSEKRETEELRRIKRVLDEDQALCSSLPAALFQEAYEAAQVMVMLGCSVEAGVYGNCEGVSLEWTVDGIHNELVLTEAAK